jgi:ribosomal protein S18 acetylase RimI-like enzyme
MRIEFKQAVPGEWKIIQTIAHATWPVTYGQLLPAGQLEYMLDLIYSEGSIKQQMERRHQFSIGYHAGEPIGFASVEKQYKSPANFMIHKLYVLPSFQGKGIGKIFLDYLAMLASQAGHDTIMLRVFVKNQNAIRFYQHLGFQSIGEEVSELGNGYTVKDYVMVRKIGNGPLS